MTDEILQLMDKRRKYRNNNHTEYQNLNRLIRSKIRSAKNYWLNQQCQEIERLQRTHDDFNLHKKLKETAGVYRKTMPSVLVNNQNEIVLDIEGKKRVWEDYISQLFADTTRSSLSPLTTTSHLTGPSITKAEIEKAIKSSKDNKAVGPDEIPAEVLKLIDNESIDLLEILFNKIYDTGQYPNDWLKSTFIALPKKSNAKKCSEHRLISLMSHALKIFLRIIHNRVYKKCEAAMGVSQFGFKEGMGTREALFCTQVLVENCKDVQKDVFICFIDYEKAFDTVRHDKLIEILKNLDIDEKEIQCIKNLYWNQTSEVRIEHETSQEVKIVRGVRQGCILSPLLFNVYIEVIFQEATDNVDEGIKGNVVNIRYADDTTSLRIA